MIKLAILYQSQLPSMKNGIQKPMKEGGYSDSGADIAFELQKNGVEIVTPVRYPSMETDKDWVFSDNRQGIENAISKGANTFWLNTVLFNDHPIEDFFQEKICIVGQTPQCVDIYDDKYYTNHLLKEMGTPIPISRMVTNEDLERGVLVFDFPKVIKPMRGRGSQGVFVVSDQKELYEKLNSLFQSNIYGNAVYVEEYLSGQEITISVMPKGNYMIDGELQNFDAPWCLPAVKRFNHERGIAPYSGLVAVMDNSAALTDKELNSAPIQAVNEHCIKAAELLEIRAPIRIDCRANEVGEYFIFDINLKPNMTGPSRPQRENQDSLTLMAARQIGWSYFDLLKNILNQFWMPNR